jgi:hypothetical protein
MKTFYSFLIILLIVNLANAQENGGPYAPDANTVLLMHFDSDITNSANNGFTLSESMAGTYVNNSISELGKAYRIDNTPDSEDSHCLYSPHNDLLNFEGSFSIEFWVKTGDLGNEKTEYPILIDKYQSFGLGVDANGNGFNGYVKFENDTEVNFYQNHLLEEGKWYHVAMVSNTAAQTVSFYVHDEQKKPVFTATRNFPAGSNGKIQHSDADLFVGGVNGSSNAQFDGWFDELRISNHAADYSEMYTPDFTIIESGESDHFEFYTDNSENTNYWLEIKDHLEEQFNKYPNYWDIPGAPDYIAPDTKTKIYLFDRENITFITGNTPDWKMGFYDCETNSIYLDNSILQLSETDETYQYYNGLEGLTIHTFVGYALQLRLNRDASGLRLPEFFAEGFGLYERGYCPNRDSIIAFKENHPEFVDDDVMSRFTNYPNTSEKDIVTAFVESNILFGGYRRCNLWYYEWIPLGWEKFLYYFYTTPVDTEQIKKYDECEYFDFYCSSLDTMFIDSMKVWLNQTRNYYVDSFEMELNVRIPMVILDQKTGSDITESADFNGGSGNINISPRDFWGGFDNGYDWLLGHEVGHVFNDFMCFAEPYYAMPFGFYHEGMANFSGYNVAGGEHRDDLWKIPAVFDFYQQKYGREPTLEEFINDPDETIDCYFFGFEFIRYLRKNEGFLKIKEFFINKMDFSVFNESYNEMESGYISYLKSLIDQNYPELITNNGIIIERGDTAVITTENLSATDQEANDDGLFFEIITEPTKGHIAKISNTGKPVTKFTEQDLKNGQIIYVNDNTSATSDFFIFVVSDEALTAGVFQFNITLTNPTAISEFENARKNQLEIYPNPATSESTISFQTKINEDVNLSIFDIQGRKITTILEKKLSAGSYNYSLGKTISSDGVYFLRLKTQEGISTQKIIYMKE